MARLQSQDAERRTTAGHGPDFLEALARGLRVLTAFGPERRQMSLSEVAEALDLPRATARRALLTLCQLGYMASEGRRFRLTPRVLELAGAYLSADPVAHLLQPACENLAREMGASCTAALLDGGDVVMIARASPARLTPLGAGIGLRLPAFASALGRVLLAALEPTALDRFLAGLVPTALTPHTLQDRAALRAAIIEAGRAGFALADQEVELGFRSIAVPLKRPDGRVVAALNLGARVEAASPEAMRDRYLPRLRALAESLRPQLI